MKSSFIARVEHNFTLDGEWLLRGAGVQHVELVGMSLKMTRTRRFKSWTRGYV
jgi:hypothetical protein